MEGNHKSLASFIKASIQFDKVTQTVTNSLTFRAARTHSLPGNNINEN